MNIYFENQSTNTGKFFEVIKDCGQLKHVHAYAHIYVSIDNQQEENLNNPTFHLNTSSSIILKDNASPTLTSNKTYAKVYVYVNQNAQPFTYNQGQVVGRLYFSIKNLSDLQPVFKNLEAWYVSGHRDYLHKNEEVQLGMVALQDTFKTYKVGDLIMPTNTILEFNENSIQYSYTQMYSTNKDVLTGQEWKSNVWEFFWAPQPQLPNNYEILEITGTFFGNFYENGIYTNYQDLKNNYRTQLIVEKGHKQNIMTGIKLVQNLFSSREKQEYYIKDLLEYHNGENAQLTPNNVFEQRWVPWLKQQAQLEEQTTNNVNTFYVTLIKQTPENTFIVFNNYGEQVKLYYGHKYVAQQMSNGDWLILSSNKYDLNESVVVSNYQQQYFRKELL